MTVTVPEPDPATASLYAELTRAELAELVELLADDIAAPARAHARIRAASAARSAERAEDLRILAEESHAREVATAARSRRAATRVAWFRFSADWTPAEDRQAARSLAAQAEAYRARAVIRAHHYAAVAADDQALAAEAQALAEQTEADAYRAAATAYEAEAEAEAAASYQAAA